MYQIYFFKDGRGKSPVEDYIRELSVRKGKDSRIKRTWHRCRKALYEAFRWRNLGIAANK